MTPSDDLAYAGIRELGRRFRSGELFPTELTTFLLRRIEGLEPTLHAFVTVTADRAMADAKAAEAAIARGDRRPSWASRSRYKDLYATRGIRTTAGSALLEDWVPDDDATCVTASRTPGASCWVSSSPTSSRWGSSTPGTASRPRAIRGTWPHPRRLIERLGRGARRRAMCRRARLRHRRLDPRARRVLRHRRPQAHVRPLQPARAS